MRDHLNQGRQWKALRRALPGPISRDLEALISSLRWRTAVIGFSDVNGGQREMDRMTSGEQDGALDPVDPPSWYSAPLLVRDPLSHQSSESTVFLFHIPSFRWLWAVARIKYEFSCLTQSGQYHNFLLLLNLGSHRECSDPESNILKSEDG